MSIRQARGAAESAHIRLRTLFSVRQVRFLVVGGAAALLELGAFDILVLAGLQPVPANILSFTVGMASSFIGYRLWSFAGQHVLGVRAQLGAYGVIAAVNSMLTSVLIHVFVGLGVRPWVAKTMCMALAATWNFLLLNRIVFRRMRGREPRTSRDAADEVAPSA